MAEKNEKRDLAIYAFRNLPSTTKEADKESAYKKIYENSKTVEEIQHTLKQAPTKKSLKDAITHVLTIATFTAKADNLKWLAKQAPDDDMLRTILGAMAA